MKILAADIHGFFGAESGFDAVRFGGRSEDRIGAYDNVRPPGPSGVRIFARKQRGFPGVVG